MKKLLATALVIPFVAFAGSASADTAQGKIVDMNSWSITLSDGTFMSTVDAKAPQDLKQGDEVKVNYTYGIDNEHEAVSIERSSQAR